MSSRTAVLSPKAPAPSPLMSQAIISNGLVFCSGSLGLDPFTGKFVEGDVSDRATRALQNLDAVLEAAGTSLANAVKINIFLSSMEYYAQVNEAYAKFFTSDPKPARTCVVAAELPLGAELEIEAVAALD